MMIMSLSHLLNIIHFSRTTLSCNQMTELTSGTGPAHELGMILKEAFPWNLNNGLNLDKSKC